MQDADDRDPVFSNAKINHVSPDAPAAVTFAEVIAGHAELRTSSELTESRHQIVCVLMRLIGPPFFKCVLPDPLKIAQRRRR